MCSNLETNTFSKPNKNTKHELGAISILILEIGSLS